MFYTRQLFELACELIPSNYESGMLRATMLSSLLIIQVSNSTDWIF